ncbi:hypothetical protein [Mesoplasma photuris]|uniref:hypothetical protein n=1 Tax=Mesoplasma photuris TaxID=217731 RepID=UPI0004E1464A|nr:hypothetical protein [Mesoplasma photuris]
MGAYGSLQLWQKIVICSLMGAGLVIVGVGAIVFGQSIKEVGLILMISGVSLLFISTIFWVAADIINKKRKS